MNFQKRQVLFYMKVVGIIAEYNPFHKGHEYQIRYARVLGFQKNSAPLLSQIKKNSSIPLITKAADASAILDETALRLFNETCAASNLYEMLLCHKTGQPFIHEMKKPLRII